MQPKAQFTADERRRMEAYHARPPGEPNNMPNHTSPPPCSSSSSSPLPDGVSVASASSGRSSAPAGVLPARSRYGREYKRPRPFTPPSAARAKRQTSILATAESAQALDFDEVDQVADEADLDEPVLENEARSDQPADTSLQPEQPDVIQDADANPHVSGAGFCCPFEQCRGNQTRWLAIDGLTKHLDQVHKCTSAQANIRRNLFLPPLADGSAQNARRCIRPGRLAPASPATCHHRQSPFPTNRHLPEQSLKRFGRTIRACITPHVVVRTCWQASPRRSWTKQRAPGA